MEVCSRCILDDTIPGVVFDEGGVCNYCHQHDAFNLMYPMSYKRLYDICDSMKVEGIDKEFDAVVGVSGGCDSSYMLVRMKQMGLRLLGVHADNGWDTNISKENMRVMSEKLEIPIVNRVVDYELFNKLCKGFLYASTPDADIVNDLMLLEVIQQEAYDREIGFVLNGHSFRTEGMAPLGWTYMDGGYLEDVNKKFCGDIDLSGFPHLSWDKQMLFWERGIKNIRPLYLMDYHKGDVKKFLSERFGWKWYEGLHAENIYTKFVGRYLWVEKFGIEYRKVEYSAVVRSGMLTREEALSQLSVLSGLETEYLELVKSELGFDDDEFQCMLLRPVKSYHDYDTYLPRFRDHRYKDFFRGLLDEQKISLTFYNKYILGVC